MFSEGAELATSSAEGRGVEYVQRVFRRHHAAYPDLTHEVLGCIENGDGTEIALDMRFTGTHQGELNGPRGAIAATGRTLRWRSADHVRTRGGRIVSWRAVFDRLTIREQLGLERAAGGRG